MACDKARGSGKAGGENHSQERRASALLQVCSVISGIILAVTGCWGDDGGDIARLIIDTDMEAPFTFNEIQVTVTASRTLDGNLCEPASEKFTIEDKGDLPLVVDFYFGSEYRSWVAFRVACLSGGTPVYQKEVIRPFFDGERNEIEMWIESVCFGVSCESTQQCSDGVCVDLPYPGPFNTPTLIDSGTTCDSRGEPL